MQKYLINFDLDETLADIAKPVLAESIQAIQRLIDEGHIVTINSGKPVYYLVGLCRQAGLRDVWLVGENGASLCYGIDLPLKERHIVGFKQNTIEILSHLKQEIRQQFGEKIWFQPNEVMLSPFFDTLETKAELADFLAEREDFFRENNIRVFPLVDCFDITQNGVDKGSGVKFLCRYLGIPKENSIAVGDTLNDIPMFKVCGHSILINYAQDAALPPQVMHVGSIEEAFGKVTAILNT